MKGFFVKNGVIPASCFKCELGMADEQIPDCPFYQEMRVEQKKYKNKRHPDCPLKEMKAEVCKWDEAFTVNEMKEETGRCAVCKMDCSNAGKDDE